MELMILVCGLFECSRRLFVLPGSPNVSVSLSLSYIDRSFVRAFARSEIYSSVVKNTRGYI